MRGKKAKALRRLAAMEVPSEHEQAQLRRAPEAPEAGPRASGSVQADPASPRLQGEAPGSEGREGSDQPNPAVVGRAEHRRFVRSERHRINGRVENGVARVLEMVEVDGVPKVVARRGYGHYSATKRRPWVVRARNRRAAAAAKISRRRNRS